MDESTRLSSLCCAYRASAQAAALVAALAVLALAALPYRLGLVLAIVLGLLAGAAVARRGEARR